MRRIRLAGVLVKQTCMYRWHQFWEYYDKSVFFRVSIWEIFIFAAMVLSSIACFSWKLWRLRNDPYLPFALGGWMVIIGEVLGLLWILLLAGRTMRKSLVSEWDKEAHLLGDALEDDDGSMNSETRNSRAS